MKILLTGATGFLGSHLAERLAADGHELRALVRATSDVARLESLGVTLVSGAVHPAEGLAEAVGDVEAVVHCAGVVKARNEAAFDAVNAEGTRALVGAIEAAPRGPRRLVLISSIAAAGPPGGDGPVSAYGRSKKRGEEAVLAAGSDLHVSILRPPPIYGPRDQEFLPVYRAVSRGLLPVVGRGENTFGMCYVADCVEAVVALLDGAQESGGRYFVDDGGRYTSAQLAEQVAAALEVGKLRRLRLPKPVLWTAGQIVGRGARLFGRASMLNPDKVREMFEPDWVWGHEALRQDTGWQPRTTLAEGLRPTLAWAKAEGLL